MGIQNITYRALVNKVVEYIVSNSYNIDTAKFNSLPNYFKSGYTQTVYTGTSSGDYKSHAYISISGNIVSKVSNTVNTDLVNFLSSAGYTSLDTNISSAKFIGFFNNLVSFCSRYLRFSTSQFTQSAYLVYGDNGSSVTYTGEPDDIVYAKSMNDILSNLQNRINVVVRCSPVRYNYTFD